MNAAGIPAAPNIRLGATVDKLGTITARIGHAWDRWLAYVKGGVAWAHDTCRAVHLSGGGEAVNNRPAYFEVA